MSNPRPPRAARPPKTLKARAIGLLARREHSRAELRERLLATGADREATEALLDELAALGFLSDARFAHAVVRQKQGRTVIQLGIGIDSGEVTAGYFGSPMRMEYTVMGDRVNTASRFCGLAEAGQVIVGEETWRSIEGKVDGRVMGKVRLKGKELEVNAYEVLAIR